METGTERLIGRKDGAIGWMIFNNPERRNAISTDMWQAIPTVMEAFDADPEVRVVVFTGAGDKAFISGADISQFESRRSDATSEAAYSSDSGAANAAMARLSKPSIAMIRGYCIGGGLAVALTCDLRICAEAESRWQLGAHVGEADLDLLDGYVGAGYAKSRPEELATLCALARRDGVVLDPVYTGKAFHALSTELRRDRARFGASVAFVHTGGLFGTFASPDLFAAVAAV